MKYFNAKTDITTTIIPMEKQIKIEQNSDAFKNFECDMNKLKK